MSYRSHGTDDARYSYIEGSPSLASPYTPESDQFLISPASPNRPPHTFESEYSQLPKREIPRKPVPSPQYAPTESSRPPPKLSRTKALFPKWTAGLHWYVPTTMTLVFLCGCAGAIAHHVFYSYLHGKPAHNQLMMNRIGVAFAFFTKASLVGSVILAYR